MNTLYGPIPLWACSHACCATGNARGERYHASVDADQKRMQLCLDAARTCVDEVPIAALVHHPEYGVIALERNRSIERHDPSGHAEMLALRSASLRMQNYRLPSCTLYTTLEPCPMCFYAIMQARLCRVVFAAIDTKIGMMSQRVYAHTHAKENHHFFWTQGVLQSPCERVLLDFFARKR